MTFCRFVALLFLVDGLSVLRGSPVIEPRTGRVIVPIETFNITDSDLFSRVLMQNMDDEMNRNFTPIIAHEFSRKEETALGPITLSECIFAGRMSTVWTIEEHPDWLVKYQADCDYGVNPHPLIKDYWYMNDANGVGLAPRAHFLSPPSLLCESNQGKCGFTMNNITYENCKNSNRTLRYMLMDRAEGVSLHEFRDKLFRKTNGAIGLMNAAVIGAKLIRLLHDLHRNAKVVHGDIHSPNVMINIDPVTKNATLKLIDFGHAFAKSLAPLPRTRIRPPGQCYHELFTIYQMSGYAWSATDDILKAIQTIAHLMHPVSFFAYEAELKSRGAAVLRDWKLRGNWFVNEVSDPVAAIPNLPEPVQVDLYRLLNEILHIVRSLGINSAIPYTELIDRFTQIAILSSRVMGPTAP